MKGLKEKKYLQQQRKRFDPISLVVSSVALALVLLGFKTGQSLDKFVDIRSIMIVGVGTSAALLFQFDLSSFIKSIFIVFKSFLGTPDKSALRVIKQLDDAILNDNSIYSLRDGEEITGDLLNDIVYMHQKGLLFEEIDEFVTSRIQDEFIQREIAQDLLTKAAIISPSLGLFGTVLGLVGVLQSLSDPSQIGPSMSMALMTTAYGAGLGTLVFSPLAGRIEHHNKIYLESHKQLLSKIGILVHRENRVIDNLQNNLAAV